MSITACVKAKSRHYISRCTVRKWRLGKHKASLECQPRAGYTTIPSSGSTNRVAKFPLASIFEMSMCPDRGSKSMQVTPPLSSSERCAPGIFQYTPTDSLVDVKTRITSPSSRLRQVSWTMYPQCMYLDGESSVVSGCRLMSDQHQDHCYLVNPGSVTADPADKC